MTEYGISLKGGRGMTSSTSRPENSMQTLISDLVSHLLTHGQYSSLFEPFYLDITQSFYASESMAHWDMVNVDTGAFIAFVNSRVEEERQRAKAVLPSRSWKIVEDVTEKALLGGRLEELALKGIFHCLVRGRSLIPFFQNVKH